MKSDKFAFSPLRLLKACHLVHADVEAAREQVAISAQSPPGGRRTFTISQGDNPDPPRHPGPGDPEHGRRRAVVLYFSVQLFKKDERFFV